MFDRQLQAAIRRWDMQKQALADAEAALIEADKQKLVYTAKRLRDNLPRMRLSCDESAHIVAELQKAKPSK